MLKKFCTFLFTWIEILWLNYCVLNLFQSFIKPLIDLIHSTNGRSDMVALHEKSVNVFKSKLCQSKNHQFTVPATGLHDIMKYVMESAKRSGNDKIHVSFWMPRWKWCLGSEIFTEIICVANFIFNPKQYVRQNIWTSSLI